MTACAPPNENCAPPSEDCAPKELTKSALLECKSRPKLVFFVDWQRISWRFWDEDLFFFWRSPVFGGKNCLKLRLRAENSLQFQWRPFFWRSPFSGRKIPLKLCFSPCSFDPDWDKFLVPLSNSHKINCSCPLKFISALPVTLSWRRACYCHPGLFDGIDVCAPQFGGWSHCFLINF